MRHFFPLILVAVVGLAGSSSAQSVSDECQQKARGISQQNPIYVSDQESNHFSTLKIENGKIWINGNLSNANSLPESLREINPSYFLQTTVYGQADFSFSFQGKKYLLKRGQIIESNSAEAKPMLAQERSEYLNHLRSNQPDIFSGLFDEAMIHDQLMRLSFLYHNSVENERSQLRVQIREILDILFEMNLQNQEAEIKQIEKDILILKREMEFRVANKDQIIENRMKEILSQE